MHDAVGERAGLARTRPRDDEQRRGARLADTMLDGAALIGVELIKASAIGESLCAWAPCTRQAASAAASFGLSLRLPLSTSVYSATMRQRPPFKWSATTCR
jgi:hypothetical protein